MTEAQKPLSDEDVARLTVVSTDHPLSLGRAIILATNSRWVRPEFLVPAEFMDQFDRNGCDARCHPGDETARNTFLFIWDVDSKVRIIELVAHECSHIVDDMFARCAITAVDTEVRAYYLDWLVGKVMHAFTIID